MLDLISIHFQNLINLIKLHNTSTLLCNEFSLTMKYDPRLTFDEFI